MRTAVLLLALGTTGVSGVASPSGRTATAAADAIEVHLGVPGVVYVGQPLPEFIAKFPGAQSTPVAGQPEVVRLQVEAEGISCLAMGKTPASMTIESIGFNFGDPYEGVRAGKRRTKEGIGSGSTVNDLLGTYGRPAETTRERRPVSPPNRWPGGEADPPTRHLYRSADGAATTYFIVEGHEVVRMVIGRPGEIEKHISTQPAGEAPPSAQEGGGAKVPPRYR